MSDIEDPLFNKRYGYVKDLVCSINDFVKEEKVTLSEFLTEVNDMYQKGEKLIDFPNF